MYVVQCSTYGNPGNAYVVKYLDQEWRGSWLGKLRGSEGFCRCDSGNL